MGYREISLKLPTDYTEDDLKKKIGKELHLQAIYISDRK